MRIFDKYNEVLKCLSDMEREGSSLERGDYTFSAIKQFTDMKELADDWLHRVVSLRKVCVERGYTAYLQELDEFSQSFMGFVNFATERMLLLDGRN